MTGPHLFTVEGETFAFGLFWQPLSASTPAERSKEILSLAQELSFDLAVTRNSAMHCVGFAKSSQTLKVGIFSAAAVISKTLDVEMRARDFIFVSPLPDGQWAYVAQRDGVILPDGDKVFASEDGARAALLEHMSLGDWSLVIVPAIWGINGSVERDFLSMLPRKKNGKIRTHKWWRLMPANPRRAVMTANAGKIALIAVVAGVALGGGLIYKKWKSERDARLAAEAAAAAAAMQAGAAGQVVRPENPWKSQPLAHEMVRACLTTLSTQRVFPGNWDLISIECSGGQLKISWKPRAGGWIKHLREIEPSATIAVDGSDASASVPLPAMKVGYDEEAPAQNDRLSQMYATAQAYGVTLVAEAAHPDSAPVLPGRPAQAPQVFWKEVKWSAQGVVLPDVVLAALDGPGFRMSAMRAKWVNGNFVWTMEGTQYVQP
jgi:hypothetical protein